MARPRGVRRLFRLPGHRRRLADEVEEELEHHLRMRAEELEAEGWAPDDARRAAEAALGDRARYAAECIDERTREGRMRRASDVVGGMATEVRQALRGLRKRPGYAGAVILTLGLGMGATTAVFAVVDTLLIRDLPFPEPDDLYELHAAYEGGFRVPNVPREQALELAADDFGGVRAHLAGHVSAVRTDGDEPATVRVHGLEPGTAGMLGRAPLLGRPFNSEDGAAGAAPVVALSHAYWHAEFGGDPDVLGRSLVLDGRPHEVVAVLPADFLYPRYGARDLYAPLGGDGTIAGQRPRALAVLVRVQEEAFDRTAAAVQARAGGVLDARPDATRWRAELFPMNHRGVDDSMAWALYVSFAAVGLMMLVALVNCVNLLLARGLSRRREVGVRLSLGASRARVVAQLVVESLVLAVGGATVAVALTWVGIEWLWAMAPDRLAFWAGEGVAVDHRVLAFAGGLSLVAGVALALLPAVRAVRDGDALAGLPAGVRASEGRGARRTRSALVVAQVALSLTLLFGAGLLARSFQRLVEQDVGMQVEGLVSMGLDMSPGRYPTPDERGALIRDVRDRVAAVPGVTSVVVGDYGLPGTGITYGRGLFRDGQGQVLEGGVILQVSEGDAALRETMGTRLLAGRDLGEEDEGATPARVLVTRTLARQIGAERPADALGARFALSEDGEGWEVVGVVEDLRLEGFDTRFGQAAFVRLRPADDYGERMGFLVRVDGDVSSVLQAMRGAVVAADPSQPIGALTTVEDQFAATAQTPRFFTILMAVFSVSALALAAVGLFGLLSFVVGQRAREMGIRVALGARGRDVRDLVLRQGLRLVVGGVVLGSATALWAGRLLSDMLYETSPTDPAVLALTAGVLLATAGLASYVPARRATGVDPVEVLKAE